MGQCYDKGVGVEKDEHKALKYYLKAANLGSAGAQLAVARMYEKSDKNQSEYWYSQAMNKNKDMACLGLAGLYMNDSDFDEEKVRLLIESVENKNLNDYLKIEEKFKKSIEERSTI